MGVVGSSEGGGAGGFLNHDAALNGLGSPVVESAFHLEQRRLAWSGRRTSPSIQSFICIGTLT